MVYSFALLEHVHSWTILLITILIDAGLIVFAFEDLWDRVRRFNRKRRRR